MEKAAKILELNLRNNTWTPPEIQAEELAESVSHDVNALQSDEYLHIFMTSPYIDSIYIRYDRSREPVDIKRFAIHEGFVWDLESEAFFHERCIKNNNCSFDGGALDLIFQSQNEEHPEWHLKRYYTKGLRLLDHVYNCMKENTVKEMLYKADLDELAANLDVIDELNLLATKPSDIYDGLSMKLLRSINCPDGAALISKAEDRQFIKELNFKFPDTFEDKLNDAQCRYIKTLIKGDLVVGEVGRLFRSRKRDLAKVWTRSMFDTFMARERHDRMVANLCKIYGAMDPIYDNYIKHVVDPATDDNIHQLEFYLLLHREEYDRKIRRSNRKRNENWQERGDKYIIRYPQTINDFCREALYMQNCLLTYVEALVKNDTTILYMREANNVNQPFITIEVYNGELMQAYHRFNKDCTAEEARWITDYCFRHDISTGKFKFNARVDELF